MTFLHLSDQELLRDVANLVGSHREVTAKLVAALGEIEERRLHAIGAFSSMFDFCVKHLNMSEGEAYRRIVAARLGRRFPIVHSLIASGAVHLSALELLHKFLTDENHVELLEAASGKSKREVEELLAARFPKPDAPERIRKMPDPPSANALTLEPPRTQPEAKPARIEPLSASRYKVEFTGSAELREKIERARDLMSHSNPSRNLEVVFDRALDLLIDDLERKRLAKTKRPQRVRASRTAKRGRVARSTRREVFERDGEKCAYVSPDGRRCEARAFVQLDHVESQALGGSDDPENLRPLCHAHNQLRAEQTFGREHIERCRDFRQRKHRDPARELPEPYEKVCDALVRLGFRKPQARRAVVEVEATLRSDSEPATMELILREAIRVVTE